MATFSLHSRKRHQTIVRLCFVSCSEFKSALFLATHILSELLGFEGLKSGFQKMIDGFCGNLLAFTPPQCAGAQLQSI